MLLTDMELMTAGKHHCALRNARDIEAAVLAKLREQEPIAWFDKDMCILFEEDRESSKEILIKMGWKPVFTNPAPIPKPFAWHSPTEGLSYENHYSDNVPLYLAARSE